MHALHECMYVLFIIINTLQYKSIDALAATCADSYRSYLITKLSYLITNNNYITEKLLDDVTVSTSAAEVVCAWDVR